MIKEKCEMYEILFANKEFILIKPCNLLKCNNKKTNESII